MSSISNLKRLARWSGWMLAIVGVSFSLVFSQLPVGAISGIVRDSSGAAIPAATVTATNRETGFTRTAQTSGDGHFSLASNRPTREDFGQVRADQDFSDRDNLFPRYTIDDTNRINPQGFAQFVEFPLRWLPPDRLTGP